MFEILVKSLDSLALLCKREYGEKEGEWEENMAYAGYKLVGGQTQKS
jgi:hypothetical protein